MGSVFDGSSTGVPRTAHFTTYKVVGPVSHRCQEGLLWRLDHRGGAPVEWCCFYRFGVWEITAQAWPGSKRIADQLRERSRKRLDFDLQSGQGSLTVEGDKALWPVSLTRRESGVWALAVGEAQRGEPDSVAWAKSRVLIKTNGQQFSSSQDTLGGPEVLLLDEAERALAVAQFEGRAPDRMQMKQVKVLRRNELEVFETAAFWVAIVVLADLKQEAASAFFDDFSDELVNK